MKHKIQKITGLLFFLTSFTAHGFEGHKENGGFSVDNAERILERARIELLSEIDTKVAVTGLFKKNPRSRDILIETLTNVITKPTQTRASRSGKDLWMYYIKDLNGQYAIEVYKTYFVAFASHGIDVEGAYITETKRLLLHEASHHWGYDQEQAKSLANLSYPVIANIIDRRFAYSQDDFPVEYENFSKSSSERSACFSTLATASEIALLNCRLDSRQFDQCYIRKTQVRDFYKLSLDHEAIHDGWKYGCKAYAAAVGVIGVKEENRPGKYEVGLNHENAKIFISHLKSEIVGFYVRPTFESPKYALIGGITPTSRAKGGQTIQLDEFRIPPFARYQCRDIANFLGEFSNENFVVRAKCEIRGGEPLPKKLFKKQEYAYSYEVVIASIQVFR